jgi:ubiquitin-conjugating enzyme E2 variant
MRLVDAGMQDPVAVLERGYQASHRLYELCGVVATSLTGAWLAARLCAVAPPAWWLAPALLIALVGADLVSGLVHWGFDSWGDFDTPLVGRLAIRAFRQHHLDPGVMLRHDFIETNGHNITLALTLTLAGLCLAPGFVALCLLMMALCVSFTSQIHKWAHTPRPPRLVRLLQRTGLLLSPAHHQRHHLGPHDSHYCITVGWLNLPLDRLRLFDRLERLIVRTTGAQPRRVLHRVR